MSNFIYDKAKEKFLSGQLNWGVGSAGDTFKAMLLNSTYIANQATHTSLVDIPQSSRLGISANLTNKNVTSGIASANPATFTNLPLSATIKSIVIFKQNNEDTESQSQLVAYIDTATGITNGLPITLSTATIDWALDTSSPPQKRWIFKL